MSESTTDVKRRYIPENVFKGKRIMGFKPRNVIEGVVFAVIAAVIIAIPPFVPKVQWILIGCVGLYLIIMCAIGIDDQAPTELLKNYLMYKKYMNQYSYRRIKNDKQEAPKVISEKGKVIPIQKNRAFNFLEKFFYGK